jgi:hypothetical protein
MCQTKLEGFTVRYNFHPSDRLHRAMFYRSHDVIAERNMHFFAIQNGPNSLTAAEIAAKED